MARNKIEFNRPSRPPATPVGGKASVASPFLETAPVRLTFSVVLILLAMLLSAGVCALVVLAMRIPEFSSELNAWMGRSETGRPGNSREYQLYFALAVYSAPLAFGLLVAMLHKLVNVIARVMAAQSVDDDSEFMME